MKLIPVLLLLAAAPAYSQSATLQCTQSGWRVNGLETYCTMVEISAAFGGSLDVATANGAITIRGWDNSDVLVRAQIHTAAVTLYDAQSLAAMIAIDTSQNRVRASGPSATPWLTWSVSYEIFLPHAAGLTVTTANGAISIQDVQGHIVFTIGNGAASLDRLGGQVEGKIANGAAAITLAGDHWDGQGLDLKTANGAIAVNAPHEYSAHFDAATTVGIVTTNYPVHPANGKWGIPGLGGSLSFDAGFGGATIRVSTVVGTVRIEQGQ